MWQLSSTWQIRYLLEKIYIQVYVHKPGKCNLKMKCKQMSSLEWPSPTLYTYSLNIRFVDRSLQRTSQPLALPSPFSGLRLLHTTDGTAVNGRNVFFWSAPKCICIYWNLPVASEAAEAELFHSRAWGEHNNLNTKEKQKYITICTLKNKHSSSQSAFKHAPLTLGLTLHLIRVLPEKGFFQQKLSTWLALYYDGKPLRYDSHSCEEHLTLQKMTKVFIGVNGDLAVLQQDLWWCIAIIHIGNTTVSTYVLMVASGAT